MLTFDYEIKLPNEKQILTAIGASGADPNGLQYVVDSAIVMYSTPYTPRDTGMLQDSVNSSIGSGELVYAPSKEGAKGTYASYVWNGVSKNGKPFNYQKKNPLATDHWVIEAMKVHLQDVCRDAERWINGR